MKLFTCGHCGNIVYFENTHCERCGHQLGYLRDRNALVSLSEDGGLWSTPEFPDDSYVFCANAYHGACNWLLHAVPSGDIYCAACRHNEATPALENPLDVSRWQMIEKAKRRLFYSLLRLRLPLHTRLEDPVHGLSFRFVVDGPEDAPTGLKDGVFTIALDEADDAERERRSLAMGEPYRTLLGHFRHEIGHHYWDLFVADPAMRERFQAVFGDDGPDYALALQGYYDQGAPASWPQTHITAYSTAHPWEDFAETWAHYLHITDTVEMAAVFGMHIGVGDGAPPSFRPFDPYAARDFAPIADHWTPLALMLNNLNRSMGHSDAYPFVMTPAVIDKLAFVHDLAHHRH